ncbi:MAG: hypothetical protein KBA40_01605 [Candidatus Peribacteraceae bacterium]|nr:hypothetical protein [Candidatus Peribacteraceae bacterium]MBP9850141.1 hypothetical protein [Candidatus Peribacteraceae bacterium]
MVDILRFLIPVAMAQPSSLDPGTAECLQIFTNGGVGAPGLGWICAQQYVSNLTFVVIAMAASISLIMLMINGFRYMVGPAIPGGSSDQAKKGITMALVGLAVSLLAYVIIDTIVSSVTL